MHKGNLDDTISAIRSGKKKKISPFPYGLKEFGYRGPLAFTAYKKVFFQSLNHTSAKKETNIYAGYISNADPSRRLIPSGKKLEPEDFFHEVTQAKYILSPNGDRPECYRHYEVIGLGAVPITEMHPYLHRHLGPVVYNNSVWNMEYLEEKMKPTEPVVNRNLIFEDYWMSYVDHTVGVELNWNSNQKKKNRD